MSAVITIKLRYNDGSKSLSLQYPCADSVPSGAVIGECERDARERWVAAGNGERDLETHITVKVNS